MSVNRRKFFMGSLAVGLSTASMAKPTLAQATCGKKFNWVCIVGWSKKFELLHGTMASIADMVSKMTNGNFSITLVADGELNKEMNLLDSVTNGVAQCGYSSSDYFAKETPALSFFSSMPFGLTADEQLTWLQESSGQLAEKIYQTKNIKALPAGNIGSSMGIWSNKKIDNIEDLKELKIYSTGVNAQIFESMGAKPETMFNIPPEKVAEAMRTGKLDAVEVMGAYDEQKLGVDKVASYYYQPLWWQMGKQLNLFVNQDAWNSLPSSYQEVLKVASLAVNAQLLAQYQLKNTQALQKVREQKSVRIEQFSVPVLQQLYQAVEQYHQKVAKENKLYAEVYDNWRAFVEKTPTFQALQDSLQNPPADKAVQDSQSSESVSKSDANSADDGSAKAKKADVKDEGADSNSTGTDTDTSSQTNESENSGFSNRSSRGHFPVRG